MNTYENLLSYLRNLTDNKEVMTPAQLEKVVGVSAKQQCVLRKRGDFPIPFKNMGRSIYYSIHDVAKHLLDGPQNAPEQATTAQTPALKPVATGSRTNAPVKNLSHLFTFTTLLDKITNEAKLLVNLRDSLEVHQREQREKELIKELSKIPKNEVIKKKKRTV